MFLSYCNKKYQSTADPSSKEGQAPSKRTLDLAGQYFKITFKLLSQKIQEKRKEKRN